MTHTIFHFSAPMKLSKLYSFSYCSSSHSSPKFSIIVLSEVFPVAFDCCALGFSLFFSWSTKKRSRSCPVSMVNRLELSCEITVLAMFSWNFWSLTEKKVRLEDSIYKIPKCIECYHLTIRFRNERTMRMSFLSLRTKVDAKEALTDLSTLGKLESSLQVVIKNWIIG